MRSTSPGTSPSVSGESEVSTRTSTNRHTNRSWRLRMRAPDNNPASHRICNGFQILCEAGLLSGALIRNRQLRFVCRFVDVRVETSLSPLTEGLVPGEVLRIPVKHGEGQFTAPPDDLARIEAEALVTFRYCGPGGELDDEYNVNGSADSIAGIRNPQGNVTGLMP